MVADWSYTESSKRSPTFSLCLQVNWYNSGTAIIVAPLIYLSEYKTKLPCQYPRSVKPLTLKSYTGLSKLSNRNLKCNKPNAKRW